MKFEVTKTVKSEIIPKPGNKFVIIGYNHRANKSEILLCFDICMVEKTTQDFINNGYTDIKICYEIASIDNYEVRNAESE